MLDWNNYLFKQRIFNKHDYIIPLLFFSIIVTIMIIIGNYEYINYVDIYAIVDESIVVYIDKQNLQYLIEKNDLYFNDKKIKYLIDKIEETNNGVIVNLNIENKNIFNSNVVNLKLVRSNEKIMWHIKKLLIGG